MRRLAELAGVAAEEARSFDWAAIEDGLGLRLPGDYKLLAESFPEGWFRGWVLINLPDQTEQGQPRLLNDFVAGGLEALREFQETGACLFPFSLFPEPGGALPWAELDSIGTAYWLTGPGDPGAWPVIIATEEGDYWERFDGPVSEFLAEVVTGRYDAAGFPDNHAGWGSHVDLGPRPAFITMAQAAARDRAKLDAAMQVPPLRPMSDLWPSPRGGWKRPANEMAVLRDLLGAPSARVPRVNWDQVHARLGLRLPADYREFIDTYGPGMLGDVRVTAPGAPGGMNLFELLERTHARTRGMAEEEYRPPLYPEPGGIVCWGEDQRGSILGWGPGSDDPDDWLVVVMGTSLRNYRQEDGLSFTGLLRQYVRREPGHLSLRDLKAGTVTFTPRAG